jgi:hypothetical protein
MTWRGLAGVFDNSFTNNAVLGGGGYGLVGGAGYHPGWGTAAATTAIKGAALWRIALLRSSAMCRFRCQCRCRSPSQPPPLLSPPLPPPQPRAATRLSRRYLAPGAVTEAALACPHTRCLPCSTKLKPFISLFTHARSLFDSTPAGLSLKPPANTRSSTSLKPFSPNLKQSL